MAIISVGDGLYCCGDCGDALESKILAAIFFSFGNFHLPHRLEHPRKKTLVQTVQGRSWLAITEFFLGLSSV
jgi:hypothetical protein